MIKLLFRKVKSESYFKPLSHNDSDFMIPSYESIIINSYMFSNWSITENFTTLDYDNHSMILRLKITCLLIHPKFPNYGF